MTKATRERRKGERKETTLHEATADIVDIAADISPDVVDSSRLSRETAPEQRAIFLPPTNKYIGDDSSSGSLLAALTPVFLFLLLHFPGAAIVIVCNMSDPVETMRNDWRQVFPSRENTNVADNEKTRRLGDGGAKKRARRRKKNGRA
jgi:hypothetical protein